MNLAKFQRVIQVQALTLLCSFLIVSLSRDLSLYFMCSDQHVKYRMPRGFPFTSSLLLDYHVKQYIHTHTSIHTLTGQRMLLWPISSNRQVIAGISRNLPTEGYHLDVCILYKV